MIFLKEIAKCLTVIGIVILVFILWLHTGKVSPNEQKQANKVVQKEEKPKADNEEPKVEADKSEQVMVQVNRKDAEALSLSLEVYLEGVIGSEMPVSFEMEALKAQCVAARTFAASRDFSVDNTTSSQVFYDETQQRKTWGDQYEQNIARVKQAIEETKGEVITYEGNLISAVFFSSSCGKTANSEEYWKNESAYLRSVDSPWDQEESGFEKTVHFDASTFASKLGFENAVTTIGEPKRYTSGYVNTITIDQINFSGRVIREKLGLRSSCFTIVKSGDGYDITTKGYGHGLGMSQYGAQGMAKEGSDYKQILTHYYTGVKIEKKYV